MTFKCHEPIILTPHIIRQFFFSKLPPFYSGRHYIYMTEVILKPCFFLQIVLSFFALWVIYRNYGIPYVSLTRFVISKTSPYVPQTCQPAWHRSAGLLQDLPQEPISSPHLAPGVGRALRFFRPDHHPLQPATLECVKKPSLPPSEQPVVRALSPYLRAVSSVNLHWPYKTVTK